MDNIYAESRPLRLKHRQLAPGSLRRWMEVASYWVKACLPLFLVLCAGATVFRTVVVSSIQSTPHPAIVYSIFVAMAVGIVYTVWVLTLYVRQETLGLRWQRAGTSQARAALLNAQRCKSPLMPVFRILSGKQQLPLRMRQAALDRELDGFEHGLLEQLSLPNYVVYALVGLGLVGTFAGLLGTLDDLGKLFASSGAAGAGSDPGAMFADMVRKLQEPMRRMGTAFVTSIYGLLGSLILGLMVLSVKKTGSIVTERMRDLVREEGPVTFTDGRLADNLESAWLESDRWSVMFDQMQRQHDELLADAQIARENVSILAEAVHVVAAAVRERSQIDSQIQKLMATGAHWIDSWSQISEELSKMRSNQEASSRIALQLQSDQCAAMQQLSVILTRMELGAEINASRLLGHMSNTADVQTQVLRAGMGVTRELETSIQACREEFEACAKKLRSALAMQVDRDSSEN